MFHEAYEIIHETLCDLHSGSPLERKECREADRFAAAVLMQPEVFAFLAEASRFDVIALQKAYACSCASVTLRLAEVMREQPLLAVLYERRERGDPIGWAESPAPGALPATVVRRTPGFGAPDSRLLCGSRGRHAPGGARPSPAARWPSRLPAPAGRRTLRRSPSQPGPSSGRGGWPTSWWSPRGTATRPSSRLRSPV